MTLLVPGPFLQHGLPRPQIILSMTTDTNTFRLSVHCDRRPFPSEILCLHPWHCDSTQIHKTVTLKSGLVSHFGSFLCGHELFVFLVVPYSQETFTAYFCRYFHLFLLFYFCFWFCVQCSKSIHCKQSLPDLALIQLKDKRNCLSWRESS